MRKYRYEKDLSGYIIRETTTKLAVFKTESLSDAMSLCKHLNNGGGFDGFTPTFVSQPFGIKTGTEVPE